MPRLLEILHLLRHRICRCCQDELTLDHLSKGINRLDFDECLLREVRLSLRVKELEEALAAARRSLAGAGDDGASALALRDAADAAARELAARRFLGRLTKAGLVRCFLAWQVGGSDSGATVTRSPRLNAGCCGAAWGECSVLVSRPDAAIWGVWGVGL